MPIRLSWTLITSEVKASSQYSMVTQANTPQSGVAPIFTRFAIQFLFTSKSHTVPFQNLLSCLHASPGIPVPDVLNQTFHKVDESLSKMCEESEGKIHSGCTAVTAFLRIEDADGRQSYLSRPSSPAAESPTSGHSVDPEELGNALSSGESVGNGSVDGLDKFKTKTSSSSSRIRKALRSLTGSGSSSSKNSNPTTPRSTSPSMSRKSIAAGGTITVPPVNARRVLYSANAGDARGVLCRGGKAVRLTYDHKGSDKQEAKRIMDAGGFVMSGRVNGVLAVTRSLGDSAMKEFVVGAPYTTETELCDEDEFLILACDGVSCVDLLTIGIIVTDFIEISFGT
jgi:protein phosphatase PTC1